MVVESLESGGGAEGGGLFGALDCGEPRRNAFGVLGGARGWLASQHRKRVEYVPKSTLTNFAFVVAQLRRWLMALTASRLGQADRWIRL